MQKHDRVTLAHLDVRHLAAKNPPPLLFVRNCRRDPAAITRARFTHRITDVRTCETDIIFPNEITGLGSCVVSGCCSLLQGGRHKCLFAGSAFARMVKKPDLVQNTEQLSGWFRVPRRRYEMIPL